MLHMRAGLLPAGMIATMAMQGNNIDQENVAEEENKQETAEAVT